MTIKITLSIEVTMDIEKSWFEIWLLLRIFNTSSILSSQFDLQSDITEFPSLNTLFATPNFIHVKTAANKTDKYEDEYNLKRKARAHH